jgi:ATP-dependent Clp protease adaptor protein ClpS
MSWQSGSRADGALVKQLTVDGPFMLGPQVAAATESPVIEHETRTEKEVDLPWQVVVHNDPVNLMSYVTMVFQRVFGFNRETAEKHMLEVHEQGRSIVWCGLRERAELYVQQLHGYLLLATLERTT